MASRLRIGTALLGATAALAFTALPASAEVIIKPDRGGQEEGHKVVLKPVGNINDPNELEQGTAVIKLRIEDDEKRSNVLTYCVELPTPLEDADSLKEAPWGTHPNPKSKFPANAGKVLWILQNSYPGQPMDKVREKFGRQFDKEETIAATQAAIWHFSDEAQLDENKNSDDIMKLYERLIKDAKDNEIKEQPKPTLEIDPASKSGKSGEKIGPFKVTTTASEVKLTGNLPQGVTVTDAQGNPLAVQKKGAEQLAVKNTGEKVTEFFVNVPANAPTGSASFQLSAEAEIALGRLFVSRGKNPESPEAQSLVVAQPQKAKVEKEAKADWTLVVQPSEPSSTPPSAPSSTPSSPVPTTSTTPAVPPAAGGGDDNLASTGASILWPLVGGLVLVGAGVGALFVVRRKKASA